MANLIVGVGDIVVSRNPHDQIKTYALGSCVALIFYSPHLKVAGMAHIALPDSKVNKERAKKKPGYFADTAIPKLINNLKQLGIQKNSQVWIKMVGGANILDPQGKFNIGKRNVLAIKKFLWKYCLGAIAEDVGENHSRTVSVIVRDGRVIVSSPGRGEWTL
ncbi:MAG: chemotaxis protein CheD [Calditrichaeota bacterium]|nr:chemotaxis protein CheD [Calditrichota bacterium]